MKTKKLSYKFYLQIFIIKGEIELFKNMLPLFILVTLCMSQENRKFEFKYQVDIASTKGEKLEAWIPYPKSNEVQNISNVRINTDLNYDIKTEEKHGNKYIYVNEIDGTKKESSLVMTFNANRKEHKNQNFKSVNPKHYLGSYGRVPTGDIFKKIIDDNNLSKNNMRAVYDYVLSGMHYGKPKSTDNVYYKDPWLSDEGRYGMKKVTRDEVVTLYQIAKKKGGDYTFGNGNSMYACDIGVGNCTDYHSYFMSLSRTLDVPARFHMGFTISQGNSGNIAGYHCWADYYVEGEGWHPVDISEADKNPEKAEYFFGTINANRIDMTTGRDFVLEGYDNGLLNLFIYPVLEVNDKISSEFTKGFSYKNLK